MEKISICIPCFNEEKNIIPMYQSIKSIFTSSLSKYKFDIIFIDNNSSDNTCALIRNLCDLDKAVKAIFNVRNFKGKSGYYGLLQTDGDCGVFIPADFQIPPEVIIDLVEKWESGSKIVCAVKKSSTEHKLMWKVRQLFYKFMKNFSDSDVISNFTGAGLFDNDFLNLCRKINDPEPAFMQMIFTMGWNITSVEYEHGKRKNGKSKNKLWDLINIALMRFTNASTIVPQLAVIASIILGAICAIIAIIYVILKFIYWNMFSFGIAPVIIGVFFIGSIQLFFLGLLGMYIMKINTRLMNRPLVIEKERLNFDE